MRGNANFDVASVPVNAERALPAARVLIPLLFGMITFFDSWDSIAIAFVAPSIAREWSLGPEIIGAIFAIGYAGQFVGAATSGAFTERFGRVRMFAIFAALMGLLAGIAAMSNSPTQLGLIRFVQGIGIGAAVPIGISYLTEIAPTATRGRYLTLFQFITTSGFALASICSVWIIPVLGWRWMFGFGLAPLVVLPLITLLIPESPLWLASKGRLDAAQRAANRLGLEEFQAIAAGLGTPTTVRPRFKEIFAGKNLRPTVSISAVWFFTAFVGFGMVSWLPSLYVSVYHLPLSRALKYNAFGYAAYLLVPLLVALVIDRFGRRRLSIACLTVASFTFLGLALILRPSEAVLVTLAVLGQNASTACLLVMWTYTAEAFSTDVRSLATGFTTSWVRLASMIAPLVIGAILARSGSVATVFTAFLVSAAIAMVIWAALLRETSGKQIA